MNTNSIFVSYSRRDTEVVHRLAQDLSAAGFDIWLDTEDLTPGTPNWEQAIRDAIAKAAAVLLVASPDSLASVYVQGELSLAKIRQRQVYPVWAAGDDWIDCVPLDMVNYQYIDCRGAAYEAGLPQVIETLKKVVDASEGMITLGLPSHETVRLNLAQFTTSQDILNHIHTFYLQDWYAPLTYGTEWILANVKTKQLAAPWEWLTLDREDELGLSVMYRNWAEISPAQMGIRANGYWAVWEASRVRAAGVAVNNPHISERLRSEYSQRDLWLLKEQDCLKIQQPQEVNPREYQDSFVIAMFQTTANRIAFVDTGLPWE